MTNAEKYLKEGIDINQMATEMVDYFNFPPYEGIGEGSIEEFFDKEVKPTLTEDERVILKNIDKEYCIIERDKYNSRLLIKKKTLAVISDDWEYFSGFDYLFQFIKERRRI